MVTPSIVHLALINFAPLSLYHLLESQGRYGEAQRLYERALAVREAVLGAEHPDTATSVNNLAVVLEGGLSRSVQN